MKFNSSCITFLTICISQCRHNRVLYWVYTDPYCFIYWAIRKNIAPAARPIRRINSSNTRKDNTGIITFRNWEWLYYDSSQDIISSLSSRNSYVSTRVKSYLFTHGRSREKGKVLTVEWWAISTVEVEASNALGSWKGHAAPTASELPQTLFVLYTVKCTGIDLVFNVSLIKANFGIP